MFNYHTYKKIQMITKKGSLSFGFLLISKVKSIINKNSNNLYFVLPLKRKKLVNAQLIYTPKVNL